MPHPLVFAYDKSFDVAASLADFIVKIQNDVLITSPTFDVAVSGGSLVKVLRSGLLHREDVQWSKWRIFFSDERIVPLDHPDSNYGLLKDELLQHLDPATHGQPVVYPLDDRIPMDGPSDLFAESYQKVLKEQLIDAKPSLAPTGPGSQNVPSSITSDANPKAHPKVPILDLILLGCGPDGHTCSLFPGHKLLDENSKWVASLDDSPKPPPRRITLTKPVLAAARSIAFVAEGESKAPILKQIFEDRHCQLPSAQVNSISKLPVSWFVNTPAIAGVSVVNSA